jgi:death-on-curing protein
MKAISLEELLVFHRKIIEKTGGSKGIRDLNLIESALNRAFVTFKSKDLYKDIIDKIAAITYGLIKNHGFVDGNKRIGIAVMLFLLKLNELKIRCSQKELIKLGLGIADGLITEENLRNWIRHHEIRQVK